MIPRMLLALIVSLSFVSQAGAVCTSTRRLPTIYNDVDRVVETFGPLQQICRQPLIPSRGQNCSVLVRNVFDVQGPGTSTGTCLRTRYLTFSVVGKDGPASIPENLLLDVTLTATDGADNVAVQTLELGRIDWGVPFDEATYPEPPLTLRPELIPSGFNGGPVYYLVIVEDPYFGNCSKDTAYAVKIGGNAPGCGAISATYSTKPSNISGEVPQIFVPESSKVPIECRGSSYCPEY